MEIEGKVYIGISDGHPYIHIYRKGFWPTESIRVSLYGDDTIHAGRSSKKIWREWAEELKSVKASKAIKKP